MCIYQIFRIGRNVLPSADAQGLQGIRARPPDRAPELGEEYAVAAAAAAAADCTRADVELQGTRALPPDRAPELGEACTPKEDAVPESPEYAGRG